MLNNINDSEKPQNPPQNVSNCKSTDVSPTAEDVLSELTSKASKSIGTQCITC